MPPAHAVSFDLRPTVQSGIISPRHSSHDKTVLPSSACRPLAGHGTSVTLERMYQDHVDLIDSVITLICRRKHLSAADAADFRQDAHLTLLERGVLEKYQGRSSLRTFLLVVLMRMYKDFRIKDWGKWRPSVEAQRQGEVAIRLEQLIVRDGLTFDEALETLRTNHGVTASRAELEALAGRLPLRVVRKAQSDDVLVVVPSAVPAPDVMLSREEMRSRAAAVRRALLAALRDLDADDRLVIKLRYVDGLPIVKIAGLLQIEAKPLYRRIEQLLARLRRALEAEGVDPSGLFDEEP
jgi:RNA polymerase sigma factor (sigma-70 family)